MINAYITFNGNCREAMTFYQECLGGELSLQTTGYSPLCGTLPTRMKDVVLHATLINKNFVLMGSDMADENGLIKGNTVSLLISCKTENEIHRLFKKLSQDSRQITPLQINFWGALSGSITDKYNVQWLLYCAKQMKN